MDPISGMPLYKRMDLNPAAKLPSGSAVQFRETRLPVELRGVAQQPGMPMQFGASPLNNKPGNQVDRFERRFPPTQQAVCAPGQGCGPQNPLLKFGQQAKEAMKRLFVMS